MTVIDTVVCVHGFWSHGTGMYLIKRRLEKEFGFRVRLFNYRSVRRTLDENADALSRFIHEQDVDGMHIIGHSLGGVLALRMLANDAHVGTKTLNFSVVDDPDDSERSHRRRLVVEATDHLGNRSSVSWLIRRGGAERR